MTKKNSAEFETLAIRNQYPRSQAKEHSVPVFLTSSFTFDSAERMRDAFADENDDLIYSRFSNPNAAELIDKLSALELADAGFATASGMAAVFSCFAALCDSGDEILACRSVFGSTHSIFTKVLPRWGITTHYVDADALEFWEDHLTEKTKILYIETPTNPGVDVIDLEYLGEFAKQHGLIFVVDNCFATPYLQQPIKFGANLVIHSGTKWIDGQGRVVGGAILGDQALIDVIRQFCRNTGPSISPFNAWVMSKSLETLAIRMDKHSENALTLAKYLESNERVDKVYYPFLESHPKYAIAKKQMRAGGGILTFYIKGTLDNGRRFLNAVNMCSLTANIGDTRSIVTHPASTTHAKLSPEDRSAVGISDTMIRVSVGLEHINDIIADIQQALEKM
ncbi:MAG: aminotransferase class I/II-fold pyridoxal phosphate-dependent enzyme [Gammaproteobacteria bacterium]|nr:aminotransferase class I/II-fold pyridoxal phosphate-dependent enzyme [Gammaproteobacteria bacterium]NNC96615.1 aminotransferase class I/II-fold pyridoxal phosphate-dependent enzyme [Gammaproteobacteria bacterium]NNM12812.1 aminotransferase class I/II-fold pyridoxal phosphate-dependent enzyme [Gammaproteobacteria bacterium]